ncbi:DUF2156 domain-containing protein [Thioclava sp. BHET1]|nr:DUF2156 domain-containing protein [Thioclava sp. BHET1]
MQTEQAGRLPGWARAARRQIIVLAVLAGLALVLRDRITHLDWPAILSGFAQVTALQWLGAALATIASFAALAKYDALLHRMLGTGQPSGRAGRAGWVAIAISQTLGFGLISGALVRWRMLPGLSLLSASRLTLAVAASFLAGWAVLSAAVLLILPLPMQGQGATALRALAGLALLGGGAVTALALYRPNLRLAGWKLRLPPLVVQGRILWLCALDTAFAALALWLLLPAESGIGFLALYPAFLIALGAGFVSGSPGGVGPFEVTLLALLPPDQTAPILAAILAWRLVYYAAPTLAAMGMLARPPRQAPELAPARLLAPDPDLPVWLERQLARSDQAELGLLRQGEHGVLIDPGARGGWMIGRTPQALVGLLDPFGARNTGRLLDDLRQKARDEGRIACAYKLTPRAAARARKAGWHVTLMATECWLETKGFSTDQPARAGLRRKLRKAAKAGIRCTHEACIEPTALTPVAARWHEVRGGERGFSMGRFCPDYIAGQSVIVARKGDEIVGFASFHTNDREWVLDLMRPAPNAPDGTMQALIVTAIEAARISGATRLSLAALPPCPSRFTGPARHVWQRAERMAGAAGLRQFKLGFAPHLSPRYMGAPTRASLLLGGLDIARQIHAPPPLPGASAQRHGLFHKFRSLSS